MRRWLDWADFGARIVFFAVAPFLVFVMAAFFPVTATLVNLGLCLAVVSFADVVRAANQRFPILSAVLTGPLDFERYYRNHPPKPFAYYIFYPLLFPYWLANDSARREFLLYKTVNLLSLGLLVGTTVYEYFAYFRPELGVRECLIVLFVTALFEIVVVMTMLMPLATSLIKYRLARHRGRLATLVVVGACSVALAIFAVEKRRDPVVSWAARERVLLRTKANKPKARAATISAAKAAWAVIPKHKDDVDRQGRSPPAIDSDGKVEGEPLEAARAALKKFYKPDEAQAFDGWVSHAKKGNPGILVLYVESRGKKRPPIFIALDRSGKEVRDPKKLPKGALDGMKLAADDVLALEL
ncbi:MAG TPA: hypothetical protein VGH87_03455 [Polyangiaceae bacterium]|jgi:hypothetical protein